MKFSSISSMILISSILLIAVAPIQCHLQQANSIENICRATLRYDLCTLALKSQQPAAHDVAACARGMLKFMISKAPTYLERIQAVLTEVTISNLLPQKHALESCHKSYSKIIKELLPKALNCMDEGDYNGAIESVNAVGKLAKSCMRKCFVADPMSSMPLDEDIVDLRNLSSITVSFITQISQSKHQTLPGTN